MVDKIVYGFLVWFVMALAWAGSEYYLDGEVISSTTDFIVSLVLTYYIVKAKEADND